MLFGIFAHPDDEAFGPSASLYNAAQNGTDVHLLLATNGENGNNPDNVTDLGHVREKEWQASAQLIGAKSAHALRYPDGGLSNNVYHDIANTLLNQIEEQLSQYSEPLSIDFMTFERNGISGHLDHIAISYITTYVFLKLKEKREDIATLKYFCLAECIAPAHNTHWIYMSKGKADAECDEVFDYSHLVDKKLEIMRAHNSQRDDMQAILAGQETTQNPCRYKDHFCYFKD